MDWKTEYRPLAIITAIFLVFFFLPAGTARFDTAVLEALHLAKWYAREHVLLCLIPAFFIAGAIAVFVSQASVIRYLGPKATGCWPMVWLPSPVRFWPSVPAPCSLCLRASTGWGQDWVRRPPSFTPGRPSMCWPSS